MKTYTVDGNTLIGWSVVVQANNEQEAEEKAKQFWNHNTTHESVEVTGAYEGTDDS